MNYCLKKTKLATIFTLLAIIALLAVACGPGEPSTEPTPSPTGNQPPVISSLTAAQMQLSASGSTGIQCVASDPDGDKVKYTWSTSGGVFGGSTSESTAKWQAPQQYGTYDVTVTVTDGKGGSTQHTITLSVVANQNPVIANMVADPATTGLGRSSTITCTANDPDGDILTYNWATSDGNVSGVGNKITWTAPSKTGTFSITVTVTDGKGGEASRNVQLTVATATKTVTINSTKEETGTVSSDGNRDGTKNRAGDDEINTGYRSFWSFNIFSLQNVEIKDARLIFTTKQIAGKPFTRVGSASLKGLKIVEVKYGESLPGYNIIGTKLFYSSAVVFEQPTVVVVTPEIDHQVKSAAPRFQIEALFLSSSNGNGVSEWIEWTDCVLEVTYTDK